MTSMRRNDVASTSFRRHVPNRFLINQCQIITFLILKYDIIENSRIELRGIVLPVQVGGLLGGPKGMLAPPLKLLGGPGPPLAPPLPTPMQTSLVHWASSTEWEKNRQMSFDAIKCSVVHVLPSGKKHLFKASYLLH